MSNLAIVPLPQPVTARRPGLLSGCKFGRRHKFVLQRGVHRSIGLREGTATALERIDLKAKYHLRRPFVEITHRKCSELLAIRIPRIKWYKASCSYVDTAYGYASLGADFDAMLERAVSEAEGGNPAQVAQNREMARTLAILMSSQRATSVFDFRTAVLAGFNVSPTDGVNPLFVLARVLVALKADDRKRFTVWVDRACICPYCNWHQHVPPAVTSALFYWNRADLDYTRPWSEDVGLPFTAFGPSYRKTPPRWDSCESCKRPFDGKQLVTKEKLRCPMRVGTPELPQYLIVHYCGPPEIELGNGKTKMDKKAWKNLKASERTVRPIMQQNFGAHRMIPGGRRKPTTVFDTEQQAVFHLVGHSVVKPSIDHVAWRQHSPNRDHFIHFEADQYFGIDEYDYLLNGQRITFAIYKSTGEKSDEQPREHEEQWKKDGHPCHSEAVRKGEVHAPTKRVTRAAAATAQDDGQQPGPSGTQQQHQKEAPKKETSKKDARKKR